MKSVIERAKAQFKDRLDEVRVIEVPEWGDDDGPLKIYVKPANLITRDKIFAFANKGSLEALVEALMLRARDEDNFPIFEKRDRDSLMKKVDPDVIAEVVAQINADLEDEGEDADGNDAVEVAAKN